jgi:hypothetical protein
VYRKLIIAAIFIAGLSYSSKAVTCSTLFIATDTGKVSFPLNFNMPNDQWNLVVKEPLHLIYKRNPVVDSRGDSVIAAIMLYSENASAYKKDVALFCSKKMQPLTDKGVKAEKMLNWQHKDYPLSMKNAIFVKGTYTAQDLDHVIYMIYIIDKHDNGLQIYLDMTREIEKTYGNEFWDVIRSLKELE